MLLYGIAFERHHRREFRPGDFDGHVALQWFIVRPVDDSHSTRSEVFENAMVA